MAHQHLHFKEEFGTEQTREKQLRVSIALLGTLAGGVLLINSGLARFISRADGLIGFFMLLSELIEARTALGARASIESLIRLTPTRANLIELDGTEKEVKVSELRTGDRIRAR